VDVTDVEAWFPLSVQSVKLPDSKPPFNTKLAETVNTATWLVTIPYPLLTTQLN
jgi:hypothetical protein